MTVKSRPVRIFCSYAHEDDALRKKLEKHLAALRRDGRVELWSDRQIVAGADWHADIRRELEQADLILLLTSADFIESDFCYSVELQRALERFARREAMVIPIALRHVDWSGTPLEGLQALPRDAKPVTSWSNRDRAFADIARGIREAVEHFAEWRAGASAATSVKASPAPAALAQSTAAGPLPPRAETSAIAPAVSPPTPVLKMVFGALDFRPIGWFERALVVAAAIARIETSDGRGIATGFLVNAAEFGLGGNDESLLLTCYYVATDLGRVGRGAVAWFERLGVKRAFKDEVWSSPRTELDACFIRLDGSVDTPPCSLSQIDPHQMDETTPIYVAGHPLAGPLQFSLLKTRWLDYKTPRLHYRASTEAGSGGSAVFDEHWRAIALHRAAAVHMPRLHGTGQYAACEGMSLRDIREAILKSIKAKSARRRPPEAELE